MESKQKERSKYVSTRSSTIKGNGTASVGPPDVFICPPNLEQIQNHR